MRFVLGIKIFLYSLLNRLYGPGMYSLGCSVGVFTMRLTLVSCTLTNKEQYIFDCIYLFLCMLMEAHFTLTTF